MQKGGVGKTTTAVNLGAALAELGQRVLLIDLDAQGHLTLYMKPSAAIEKTIYHLLVDPDTTVTDVVQEAPQMGVHYIAADVELAGAENQLINEIGRESILRDKLEPAQKRYDFIIIDCPPSLDLIVINALVAADEVLVPLQAEFLALRGMQELLVTMERVKRRLNPRLELLGILPTLYKLRALHSQEVRRQGLRLRHHRFDSLCRDPACRPVHPSVRKRVRRREVLPCAGGPSTGESPWSKAMIEDNQVLRWRVMENHR
jgi:chromosome partitioning protein